MAKQYRVKLLKKEKLAKDTWLFSFEKPKEYIFIPGQYQTFTLPLQDGKSEWRDMTITSSLNNKELWLVTKITENSSLFKQTLIALPIGSVVMLEGPSGGFTIRDRKKSYVFLAGGIGINVFYSIIKSAEEEKIKTSMTLLVSFKQKKDMLYFDELKKLQNDKTKIVYTLTQENWEAEKGRISERLIKKYIQNISGSIFMIAGGQNFVDAMNELLQKMKVPQENIRIDYFSGY